MIKIRNMTQVELLKAMLNKGFAHKVNGGEGVLMLRDIIEEMELNNRMESFNSFE